MNSGPSFDLQAHLEKEHHQNAWSEYLKEIVYGGNDGIVTTFAVVAGFAGAGGNQNLVGFSSLAVLLFGLANLFADGVSMGLGNFLSLRSEQDLFSSQSKKELHEIRHHAEFEKAETIEILISKGYSKKDAMELTGLLMKNEKYWLNFMMHDELELNNPEASNPYLTALVTFISFVAFGSIPLLPYIFSTVSVQTFHLSIFFTFVALTLLGLLRWKITGHSLIRSVGEVLIVGGIAAAVAYFIGTFFKL